MHTLMLEGKKALKSQYPGALASFTVLTAAQSVCVVMLRFLQLPSAVREVL